MEQCNNPDCKKKYYIQRVGDSTPGQEYEEIICPHCNTVVFIIDTLGYFSTRKAEVLYKHMIIGSRTDNELVQTFTKYEQFQNQKIDTYEYDEVDGKGNIVAKYILKDSTSINPPFKNNITFKKVS